MQTRDRYDNDNVRRIFEAIARDTINNAGGTYQHKTGAKIDLHAQYGSGYVVSVAEYGEAIATPIASLGERIARVWPSHIGANVQYVGTWLHRGLVFVDGSVVLPESARDIALALARKHGQTAIFNIRTGQSEYLDAYKPTADDVYTAIRVLVGGTTPETADTLPRVSVRLCGASLDDVIARVFGADAWICSEPLQEWDEDAEEWQDTDVFAVYNDTLLPDDQSGAYEYDEAEDVLTVWGFYS